MAPALLVLAGLTGCGFDLGDAARFDEEFRIERPIKPGGRLTVESFNGAVEVFGWDKDRAEINGRKYSWSKDSLARLRIDVVESADGLTIRAVKPEGRTGHSGVRMTIHVPMKTRVDLVRSSNGGLRVENVGSVARLTTSNAKVTVLGAKGDLEANTSNGAIELREFTGGAILDTSNASITAEGVQGYFQATTFNGSIRAQVHDGAANRPLQVRTSNGSINLTCSGTVANGIRARTSNGQVELRLPPAADAQLRASTSNGAVTNEFALTGPARQSKTSVEGTIGKGGPLVDVETSNGGIRILKQNS
jgi:DUF4097 and DUF4098 domain-containing protein YvlB